MRHATPWWCTSSPFKGQLLVLAGLVAGLAAAEEPRSENRTERVGGTAAQGQKEERIAVARTTYNGCACLRSWTDSKTNFSCSDHCCNPDGAEADWCYVKDPGCESSKIGYCRPADDAGRVCASDLVWRDSEGRGCLDYRHSELCTRQGGFGAGWGVGRGRFADYRNEEMTALDACCACGGGTYLEAEAMAGTCNDTAGWTDKGGHGCSKYQSNRWCRKSGEAGLGWHAEAWGPLSSARSLDASVLEACCACGGGTKSVLAHVNVLAQRHVKPKVLQIVVGVMSAFATILCIAHCFCMLTSESDDGDAEEQEPTIAKEDGSEDGAGSKKSRQRRGSPQKHKPSGSCSPLKLGRWTAKGEGSGDHGL